MGNDKINTSYLFTGAVSKFYINRSQSSLVLSLINLLSVRLDWILFLVLTSKQIAQWRGNALAPDAVEEGEGFLQKVVHWFN